MWRISKPRQQPELDRLLGQRIGAGDDRLAGDHGGGGRQHDHRQQRPVGIHQEERILDRLRIGQHQRALPEIVERQRRQHHREPGGLDRAAAEMAEVGVERLGAGDDQEHRAERDQADDAVAGEEAHAVERIERGAARSGSAAMCQSPATRDGDEPDAA